MYLLSTTWSQDYLQTWPICILMPAPTQSVTAQSYHICPVWGPSPRLCSSHLSLSLQEPAGQLHNVIFFPPYMSTVVEAWMPKHIHIYVMYCLPDISFFCVSYLLVRPPSNSCGKGKGFSWLIWFLQDWVRYCFIYAYFSLFSLRCIGEYIQKNVMLPFVPIIHIVQNQCDMVSLFQLYLNRLLPQNIVFLNKLMICYTW